MSKQYQQPQFEVNQVIKALRGASPLQASRVLIDIEIYEQEDSLSVLNSIYEEFDSKSNLIDELVTPLALNILDGIISHKELKLNRTGLSASRIWQEAQEFDYDQSLNTVDTAVGKKQQLEAIRVAREYNKDVRKTMSDRKNLENNKDAHFKGNQQAYSSIEYNKDGSRVIVFRKQNVAKTKNNKKRAADTDHVVPVKQINDYYANNALLTNKDLNTITDGSHNLIEISNSLNRSKGAKNFSDMQLEKRTLQEKLNNGELLSNPEKKQLKNLEKHSDQTIEAGVKKQREAEQANLKIAQEKALDNIKNEKWEVSKKAGSQAAEQTGHQAIGHVIILFIKPLLFEITDSIRNGFGDGVDQKNTLDGLKFRFTRLMKYLQREVLPTLIQGAKDFLDNFFKVMIEGVLGLITGMFKSIMKIISEGFSALMGAMDIIRRPESEMSQSQKADAIVKLFAATVISFAVFYFEKTILPFLPEGFIRDIALTTLSGIASTIVVYLLDKIDIFSAKAELRSKRVKEVFDFRIQQIKMNTDAYSAESITKLAEDKLRFKSIAEQMSRSIDNNADVNPSIYALSDQFKINLDIKSTNDFLYLLENSDGLVV